MTNVIRDEHMEWYDRTDWFVELLLAYGSNNRFMMMIIIIVVANDGSVCILERL